jgi:23S rRNA (cytidine2498-2'-O)-methyltransferase
MPDAPLPATTGLPHAATPAPAAPVDRGGFILAACHRGAEAELCRRQAEQLPELRRGAWRPGAVTFRLPAGDDPPDDFFPDLVFARTVIRSLGQVAAATPSGLVAAALSLAGPAAWRNVHVWSRDPEAEADATTIRAELLAALGMAADTAACAAPGDLVLDCVIDTADRWWVGWHRAATPASCWPGGMYPVAMPADKVSRAWLKLDEAIATFAIPFAQGQRACELGAAPGGSCQRLLEAGLDVVGIDPAIIDPRVAGHPRFTHWRKRSRDVKLREFRGFDWVVSDMNIDPVSTLEAIGRIVAEAGVRPRGIVATLKLPTWSRAEALPVWLTTLREWGYVPQVRQLSTGGREVCCYATRAGRGVSRPRATRRPGR